METDTDLDEMYATETYDELALRREAEEKQRAETENIQFVAALSAQWQKTHEERANSIRTELSREHSQTTADERLIIDLVSNDAAIAELLGQVELQLAKRLLNLIDNVPLGTKLTKSLQSVGLCREGATRRVQSLLQTNAVLRGQRQLARVVPIRRAA